MSKVLKIYCLPARQKTVFMHVKLPGTSSNFELATRFVSFCMQKWRFQASDAIASLFHPTMVRLSARSTAIGSLHILINSWTTRRCVDEYFFSQIPHKTPSIEIHHPTSIDPRATLTSYLTQSYTNKILGYSLLLPTNFYLAKFYFLIANLGFTYHAFRVNLGIRSYYGQGRLQVLFNTKRVIFIPSKELDLLLKDCQLDDGDLNDDDVEKIGRELKAYGILQGYRRHRMQVLVGKYDYK